jgi:16S rRNA (cytosine1402-N4)-methyltransferase
VRPGGRVLVIAYHSLEDRIVKRRFAAGTTGCECPPDFPVCTCGRVAELQLPVRHPMRPTQAEIAANPRARSALMRVVEKVQS